MAMPYLLASPQDIVPLSAQADLIEVKAACLPTMLRIHALRFRGSPNLDPRIRGAGTVSLYAHFCVAALGPRHVGSETLSRPAGRTGKEARSI